MGRLVVSFYNSFSLMTDAERETLDQFVDYMFSQMFPFLT
jgi:hypothetical protein